MDYRDDGVIEVSIRRKNGTMENIGLFRFAAEKFIYGRYLPWDESINPEACIVMVHKYGGLVQCDEIGGC